MTALQARRWHAVATAAGAAALVAALGAVTTVLGPWYASLRKPVWQPPDWLFGPVWTVIFALAAMSGIAYWRAERHPPRRPTVLAAFALNGFLNVFWSLLFFRLERPDWALAEVVFLWLSIVALILLITKTSRLASVLLIPYLLWVSFASVLNWEVVSLNGPFRTHG